MEAQLGSSERLSIGYTGRAETRDINLVCESQSYTQLSKHQDIFFWGVGTGV